MIVITPRLSWLDWYRTMASLRGTVLLSIWPRVMTVTAMGCLVTYLFHYAGLFKTSLTHLPFTFIGLALSVFMGFRNSTSYSRFWEGRQLWGALVNTSRSLGRQIITLINEPGPIVPGSLRHRMSYYLMAYSHSLRCHLRGDSRKDLEQFLSPEDYKELDKWSHPPLLIAMRLSEMLAEARKNDWIGPFEHMTMEDQMTSLLDIQGACERIKTTPIPFGYISLMHQLVTIYCLALPFGIVDQLDFYTPFVVMIVSYAFMGLDAVGDFIDDPFLDAPSALSLGAISRTIEVNLRQQIGETDLPPLLKPDENAVLM